MSTFFFGLGGGGGRRSSKDEVGSLGVIGHKKKLVMVWVGGRSSKDEVGVVGVSRCHRP